MNCKNCLQKLRKVRLPYDDILSSRKGNPNVGLFCSCINPETEESGSAK